MISLKQRLKKEIDVEKLSFLINSIEEGFEINKADKKTLSYLGIGQEWLLSNGFSVKEIYSDEESMRILAINNFENNLLNYLLINKKELKDNSEILYINNCPFIKLNDITPIDSMLNLHLSLTSGRSSSVFEFNREIFVSELFFKIVNNEKMFLKRFYSNESSKGNCLKKQKTYIIIDYNTGFYKIGKSINPILREKTLASEKPTIKLVLICEENIENQLHKIFNKKRIRGEWFDLNADDILFLIENHNFKKP